ncbi:unnamed protein product [Zymoseptoria tritici ST99CH_1A5]|uniref:inositol-phosphate phosphatase n=1 Tax=Zymoseptoria tritici ST99CH_1A5 TaxID=1276529 RepID=A0A1Y6LDU6_ZYMTR|nr:unnamed protein product [Zymoseptoria tritici ST99CH_1A5]
MYTDDLQAVHDFLVEVAYKAGEIIRSATPAVTGHGTKKNSADLVTETDQAVEKMVSDMLKEKYPDFEFIGEETYHPDLTLSSKPTFIVDPIDGTTNFFHGHPYVCVSLGLVIEKKPVVGVIYNPFTNALYTGIKGKGSYVTDATHDHVRLPLREPEPFEDLSHCLVAVEWGSDRDGTDYETKVATFKKLCASKALGGAMVHGIRSLGSAELNLCGVAAGHLDVYWETGCWAWDVCAGWVILEEAGGRMFGAMKGDYEPKVDQRRYMAVRGGEGQQKIAEEFWGCVEGKIEVGYDGVSFTTIVQDLVMKNTFTLLTAAVLAGVSFVTAHGGISLKHEHAGEMFSKVHRGKCYPDGVVNTGNSTGEMVTVGGESLYLAYPDECETTENAIVYFTDIFGVQLLNNRLLADSLAKAGYFVVMPDLFKGDPVPENALSDPNSTFDFPAWQKRHPQSGVEAIIDSTLSSMRTQYNVSTISSVGYCFGGKYVARYLASGKGIDAGFTAHPSNVQAAEWEAIASPISIAFGALDESSTPENRTNIEEIFMEGNKTYQTVLYAEAEHGFAVRTNLTNRKKAFAQESAYFQAVRWFDTWVKDEE